MRASPPRHARTWFAALVLSAAANVALPHQAAAHGARLPLALWGTFRPAAARCQRILARAIEQCITQAVQVRVTCYNAALGGQRCSIVNPDAAVRAIRAQAQDAVDAACSELGAIEIGFLGVLEVQTDLTNACTRAEQAAASILYAPVRDPLGHPDLACLQSTANQTVRELRAGLGEWRDAFDRIASGSTPASAKMHLVTRAEQRITRHTAAAAREWDKRCGAGVLATSYGMDATTLATQIVDTMRCAAGSAYVQQTVNCDPPL